TAAPHRRPAGGLHAAAGDVEGRSPSGRSAQTVDRTDAGRLTAEDTEDSPQRTQRNAEVRREKKRKTKEGKEGRAPVCFLSLPFSCLSSAFLCVLCGEIEAQVFSPGGR